MPVLIVREGLNKGMVYPLDRNRMEIGRSQLSAIRLVDSGVSRRHAALEKDGEAWTVMDLDSRNGVLVNGELIRGEEMIQPLSDGDFVTIGNVVLVLASSSDKKDAVMKLEVKTEYRGDGGANENTASVPARAPARREKSAPAPDLGIGRLEDAEAVKKLKSAYSTIMAELRKVIIGQDRVVNEVLIVLFSGGHCIVEGVPGLAKTLMVSTLASILDLDFKRIQFTPDLMPMDITGTEILYEDTTTRSREFKFVKGPVFTNILLADEINRTPPKTQSALLEAMQEYRVTAAGKSHDLERPFFVLATQNPIEQEGTYPLPEAQLDRFMFKVFIDYPKREEEIEIVRSTTVESVAEPRKVLGSSDILALQRIVRRMPVSEHVVTYATDLVRATRPAEPGVPDFIKNWVGWGAGPRAAQYLVIGAKARAILDGRYNVGVKDVQGVALPVLRHRVLANFNAASEGIGPVEIVNKLVETVKPPSEADYMKKKKKK